MRRTSRLLVLLLMLLVTGHAIAQASGYANVFVYHRFGDTRFPSTNVPLETFRQHLELLRQESFEVITLGELVDRLELGAELPQRCAVLTIDDSYRSFLNGAMPLLKQYGYRATLFVSTDSVGGGDYLNWDQLRRLQAEGIEIGNHSSGHDYLLDRLPGEDATAWQGRIRVDLRRAQAAFLQNLGREPTLFAYPYGEFSPELEAIAREEGFRAACGQQSGVVATGDDLFTLARFPMGGVYTDPEGFRHKLFMRPLSVTVLYPESTVVDADNPPLMRIRIDSDSLDITSLRCFVPGQEHALITKVAGSDDVYEIRAQDRLTGRRSKYTLTASDRSGHVWYWFSHLWVSPRR